MNRHITKASISYKSKITNTMKGSFESYINRRPKQVLQCVFLCKLDASHEHVFLLPWKESENDTSIFINFEKKSSLKLALLSQKQTIS